MIIEQDGPVAEGLKEIEDTIASLDGEVGDQNRGLIGGKADE